MCESDVNAAMCVEFEVESNVVRSARLAVGGILSSAATAYDLTTLLAARFVATVVYNYVNFVRMFLADYDQPKLF